MSIQLNGFEISNDNPLTVMGGINVLESEDLVMRVAESFKEATEKNKINWIFKGSFDKANRSSIDSFRGPGLDEGLKILQKVKDHFKVPIITDVHEPNQAGPVSEVAHIIQIPAFLCRQTDLVIAAAETGAVIQFKKPQFLSAIEMKNVTKKCETAGNSKILICERGNAFGYNNLVVDMLNFQVLKDIGYPVIFDVTHSLQLPGGLGNAAGGRRDLFLPLAKSGLAQKIAGLFIEAHTNPDEAKCDGPCAINTMKIGPYLSELKALDDLIKDQLSR